MTDNNYSYKNAEEILDPYLSEVAEGIRDLNTNFESLTKANTNLLLWNKSFGNILGGLQARYDLNPKSSENQKEYCPDHDVENRNENAGDGKCHQDVENNENEDSNRNTQDNKVDASKRKSHKSPEEVDQWKLILRRFQKDLGKKWRGKENLGRLELVWRTVYAKQETGAALSDVVKVCGCSVLQANECLTYLIKQQLITRRKFRHGIKYFLASS